MKKVLIMLVLCIGMVLFFYPFQQTLTFTQTRINNSQVHYIHLDNREFEMIFTHSIHLTDVIERYRVLGNNNIQLLSMQYEDVAIGMPGYAEEGQTLIYEDGIYKLSYEEAILPNFTLFIGNVEAALRLQVGAQSIDLKQQLTRGKSYLVEVKRLSLFDQMKGVKFHD